MNIFDRPFLRNMKEVEIFEQNKEMIRQMNNDAIGTYIWIGMMISLISIAFQLIILRLNSFGQGLTLLVYFAIASILYHKVGKHKDEHATRNVYLVQAPVLIFSMLMGTVFDPNIATFTFVPLLVAFPIFILDKPRRVFGYMGALILTYIVLCIVFKEPNIARVDLIHMSTYGAVAIGATMFVLSNRIELVKRSIDYKEDSELDPLTGVFNRRGGEEKIRRCIDKKVPGLFILLDIDDFKYVNDHYGHSEGDLVLERLSGILRMCFRSDDILMRIGGDEFVIYSPHLIQESTVTRKLNALKRELSVLGSNQEESDNITASMGAVINDGSWPDYNAIYNEADRMLYRAKEKGKNDYCLHMTVKE